MKARPSFTKLGVLIAPETSKAHGRRAIDNGKNRIDRPRRRVSQQFEYSRPEDSVALSIWIAHARRPRRRFQDVTGASAITFETVTACHRNEHQQGTNMTNSAQICTGWVE